MVTIRGEFMKATCIEWDTDGNEELLKELPSEIEIPKEIAIDENRDFNYEEIENYLSDMTGFCFFGYVLED